MQDQNVMLTFTIGYGMLMAVDLFKEKLMVSSPAKYNIYSGYSNNGSFTGSY